jgi:hypothetical protein
MRFMNAAAAAVMRYAMQMMRGKTRQTSHVTPYRMQGTSHSHQTQFFGYHKIQKTDHSA